MLKKILFLLFFFPLICFGQINIIPIAGTGLTPNQSNQLASLAANAVTNVPVAYTFFVDLLSGNDSTGQIGKQNLPWLSLTNCLTAVTNWQSTNPGIKCAVKMGVGTFLTVSNLLPRIENVDFGGAGKYATTITTFIKSQTQLGMNTEPCLLPMGNNSIYHDFGIVQSPPVTNGALTILIGEGAKDGSVSNTICKNLYLNGMEDDIYCINTNNVSGNFVTFDSIEAWNGYDCFNTQSYDTNGSVYRFINPDFHAIAIPAITAAFPTCFALGGGTVYVQGGFLVSSNENDGRFGSCVNVRGTGAGVAAGNIWLQNVRMMYSSTNGVSDSLVPNIPSTAIRISSGSTGQVHANNCLFDGYGAYDCDLVSDVNTQPVAIFLQHCFRADGTGLKVSTFAQNDYNDYNKYSSSSLAGIYAGNGGGLTNAPLIIQAGRTNVALVGATSMTINLATSMPSTNYVPSLTDNGAAIPGLAFTTITTNSFTTSMTALTFTGNLLWTAALMTQ